ncbi:uncharacterized protein LOC133858072 isoform X1 [Alnus glutinosa]|uniref:uncharacterized protein LOC133858072 isoform X1 n=1 Tax=Alnus glutinosa TaxID=3517 RepID=UPI002D7958B4|nr:uncharacterized protein LOC133858072 isoform X1 [Alnus glutinosa]
MAMAAVARPPSIALLTRQRPKPRWVFTPLAASSSFSSSSPSSSAPLRKLVLYSKPGCCLCDGLKEKLQAAFLVSAPDSLHDIDLQIRDITSNPEWERAYQYEIPVLAKVLSDGTECKRKIQRKRSIGMLFRDWSSAPSTVIRVFFRWLFWDVICLWVF